MMIEGYYVKVITGSLAEVMHPIHYEGGWKIKEVTSKRNWPYFWQKILTVTLHLDFIVDNKYITETPIHQIL